MTVRMLASTYVGTLLGRLMIGLTRSAFVSLRQPGIFLFVCAVFVCSAKTAHKRRSSIWLLQAESDRPADDRVTRINGDNCENWWRMCTHG